MTNLAKQLPKAKVIRRLVKQCLREDIKNGDLTAQLTPKESQIDGKIITREDGIICGTAWAVSYTHLTLPTILLV